MADIVFVGTTHLILPTAKRKKKRKMNGKKKKKENPLKLVQSNT